MTFACQTRYECVECSIGIIAKKVDETQHQIEKTADTTGIFDYLFLSKSVVVFLHITQRSR